MKRNPFLPAQDRLLLSGMAFFNILVYDRGRLITGKWRYSRFPAIMDNLLPSVHCFGRWLRWICCSLLEKRFQDTVMARKELC